MALLEKKLEKLTIDDNGDSDFDSDVDVAPTKTKAKKSKTVEETYKKVSQLEHVLLRPDTYIGSSQRMSQTIWVWNDEDKMMENKEVTFPPGLYKIFDEILVNAADHAQRDKNMNELRVEIERENNRISVWNNGRGIPIEWHNDENCYVPELIFGHLLTSSNYNDKEEKTVGGRNGYGAKLANIFSTEFTVETASSKDKKKYKQVFRNNMSDKGKPDIKDVKRKEDWTLISFTPDLEKFDMTGLDDDIIALMSKRVYDIAGINPKIKVKLNGEKINIKSFQDYVELYTKEEIYYEKLDDRWEVAIAPSDGQLTQVSFVNSICTLKGGTHVNNVADQVSSRLMEQIQKMDKKIKVRPFQIKAQLSLFINCLITNPSFDSQTKETLTTKPKSFGSKWEFSESFAKKVVKSSIIKNILEYARFKQSKELSKTDGSKARGRIMGIPNLDDANKAGTRDSSKCTLILTEGISAKALVVSAFSVIGRDYYGCFPLRGKLLNVREASHKQMMANTEINNLKKILGLKQAMKYDAETVKTLRYGHVLIMTDQDHDGSHIKGLLLNFFDTFWPGLLKIPGFLQEFITPIVKTWNKKESKRFYTTPEYATWCQQNPTKAAKWEAKYLKGLGGSDAEDAKNYFSDLNRHLLSFRYGGDNDRKNIELAFSKQRIEDRKQWLADYQPGTFFNYGVDDLTYTNFVNKELILFSMADNARSIPSVCDGLKPSQRKVLWGAFKKKVYTQLKVGSLCGFVSEQGMYHHGEASLQATVVGLAQTFVGSNNINLLFPGGMFGTRLEGGKDAASARYIATKLTNSAISLFPTVDNPLLKKQEEEGKEIEPEWYCPVIPMVLVNGGDGIGTGWSTSVPNYNPKDVIANIRRMLKGDAPKDMLPWYRGFKGTIVPVGNSKSYDVHGTLLKCEEENTFRVKELPIGQWTTPYKQFLESNAVGQAEASKNPFIKDIIDNGTEVDVCFTFTTTAEGYNNLMKGSDIYKKLKLSGSVSTSNMVLFDADGRLRKYESTGEILQEFFSVRLDLYQKRKVNVLNELRQEAMKLSNRARFVKMVISGEIKVGNRKKVELIAELRTLKFDEIISKKKKSNDDDIDEDADEENDEDEAKKPGSGLGFDYLLSMPIWSLTKEKVDKLLKDLADKNQEIVVLEGTSPEQLWERDLDAVEEVFEENEKKARIHRQELAQLSMEAKSRQKGKGGRGRKKSAIVLMELDEEMDEEIPPPSERTIKVRQPRKTKTSPKKEAKQEPKKEPKTEAKEEPEIEELEDSDVDMEEPTPPRRAPSARRKASKSPPMVLDDDSDDESVSEGEAFVPPKKTRNARKSKAAPKKQAPKKNAKKPAKKNAKKAAKEEPEVEIVDDDDEEEVMNVSRSRRAPRPGPKKRVTIISEGEDSDSDADLKPLPSLKALSAARAVAIPSDDDEEEEFERPGPRKVFPSAGKRGGRSPDASEGDEDDEVEEIKEDLEELEEEEEEESGNDSVQLTPKVVPVARKRRAARASKAIVISEDEDDDSDESFDASDGDDDFYVESPAVAKKKRATKGSWKTPTRPGRRK